MLQVKNLRRYIIFQTVYKDARKTPFNNVAVIKKRRKHGCIQFKKSSAKKMKVSQNKSKFYKSQRYNNESVK